MIARGRVVRAGKTLKVCSAEVFAVKEGKETLCATSLSTIMSLYGRPDLPAATTQIPPATETPRSRTRNRRGNRK